MLYEPFQTDGCNTVLPLAPAFVNLLTNPAFDNGLAGWEEAQQSDGSLTLSQALPYRAPANAPFEVLLDLGNSTAAPQDVIVTLNDVSCTFTLQPGGELHGSYAVRGLAVTDWSGIALHINARPGVTVDNVSAQYVPGEFTVGQCGAVN